MAHEHNPNTNYGQSVTGVVIKDGKVLLARHTYGAGKGRLIIPGGYVEFGETPQDALIREYKEETGILVKPENIIGIRFNMKDWYIAWRASFVEGTAVTDGNENSEVLWLDIDDALSRDDVPDLTKKIIQSAIADSNGLVEIPFVSTQSAPYSYYGLK